MTSTGPTERIPTYHQGPWGLPRRISNLFSSVTPTVLLGIASVEHLLDENDGDKCLLSAQLVQEMPAFHTLSAYGKCHRGPYHIQPLHSSQTLPSLFYTCTAHHYSSLHVLIHPAVACALYTWSLYTCLFVCSGMPPSSRNGSTHTRNLPVVQAKTARQERSINNRSANVKVQAQPQPHHDTSNGGPKEQNNKTHTTAQKSRRARYDMFRSRIGFHDTFRARDSSSFKPFLPVTHKAPLLLTVSTSCIVLLVLLEVLSHKNAQDGGIMFAKSGGSLGTGQQFTYLYLPTIIAVCGSMIWSWIDLDVKRLENFFQLSKPGGAPGSESVLLSYPVDFLALVPISAARRRHYTVTAAGVAMCLIFWVITPLQVSSGVYISFDRSLQIH